MRRWIGAATLGIALGACGSLAWIATSTPSAQAEPPKEGWAPDPAPVATNKQWVFEIRAKDSIPSVVKITELTLEKAEPTPRIMGRWALEFYVGKELLDRLRFNVPLAGDPNTEKPMPGRRRPEFKVNTKFFVRMADHPRATILRLVDRLTKDITLFRWPPDKDGKLIPYVSSVSSGTASADPSAAPSAGPPDGGPPTDASASDAASDARFTPDTP